MHPNHTGTLTCEDGNGNGNAVFTKALTFTDFPQEEITLYCPNFQQRFISYDTAPVRPESSPYDLAKQHTMTPSH